MKFYPPGRLNYIADVIYRFTPLKKTNRPLSHGGDFCEKKTASFTLIYWEFARFACRLAKKIGIRVFEKFSGGNC